MPIVSQAEYARMRNVTIQAIAAAARRGSLPLTADRRVDVELADATWYARHQAHVVDAAGAIAAEERRDRAMLTSLVAKVQMTRRQVEQLRVRLTDRDALQAAINRLIDQLFASLPEIAEGADPADLALLQTAVEIIVKDLGTLAVEAMAVTRE